MQNIVLINNARTILPTKILMLLFFFFEVSDNLPHLRRGDNFEIAHSTCVILV